jgi:hypothetical protein
MQRDFSLFIQIKFSFWSHFIVFFFFFFLRCMVTFPMNHLNFQNSVVSDKYQHDFYFCTKLWIPKNPCEHVWSCIVLEEKGNTPKDSWCYAFMLNGYAQCVICMKQQKWRYVMKTGKHMILFNKKGSFDKESLMKLWAKLPTKIGTGWNKNQEVLQAWSNWGGFFFQNKNRLHYAPVVQFPLGQLSHKSFYGNVVLCWGSWPCLPPISSGWVIVGVWTKMNGRL